MKRAYVAIRDLPVYRRAAFVAGLNACGYDVRFGVPQVFDSETLFLSWSRYHDNHIACERIERAGGTVLIAENGYVGPGGVSPHSMNPREWYAIARGYHNDSTVIVKGDYSRWSALRVDVKPWEPDGDHVLVCPNRAFGTPGRIMPHDWTVDVIRRLKAFTNRAIRVRPHPGNTPALTPIADDLRGAWACVIWSSSAGLHALLAGVPVICDAPFWIAKEAAGDIKSIESPPTPNRGPIFECLAWAQWSIKEIETGEPFHHLLRGASKEEVRAAD